MCMQIWKGRICMYMVGNVMCLNMQTIELSRKIKQDVVVWEQNLVWEPDMVVWEQSLVIWEQYMVWEPDMVVWEQDIVVREQDMVIWEQDSLFTHD